MFILHKICEIRQRRADIRSRQIVKNHFSHVSLIFVVPFVAKRDIYS